MPACRLLCNDCIDGARKRADELVRDVLASPPPPLLRHPYSDKVGEWIVIALAEVSALGATKHKAKKGAGADDTITTAIHLLAFIRPVLQYLSPNVR